MSDFDLDKRAYVDKHNASLPKGLTHDDFRKQKSEWVAQIAARETPRHFVDFGFGTGELLEDIAQLKIIPDLSGVEPSSQLRAEFVGRGNKLSFRQIEASLENFADASIDMLTCFNVLHHIAPEARAQIARQMFAKLAPGGTLLVWEHNPLNPGTQIVVCRCEYDHDAVLLRRGEASQLFQALREESYEFVNFTPPSLHRFGLFKKTESLMRAVPLGAQYRMIFRKLA